MDNDNLYEVDPKTFGIGGILSTEPKLRKQDKSFDPNDNLYAVVFFPRIEQIPSTKFHMGDVHTISRTPEAAITKFLDRIAPGETWEDSKAAGWQVRRISIVDMGPSIY